MEESKKSGNAQILIVILSYFFAYPMGNSLQGEFHITGVGGWDRFHHSALEEPQGYVLDLKTYIGPIGYIS